MSEAKHRVFLNRLGGDYLAVIRQGLQWIQFGSRVKPGDRVFLKPNLTFPDFRQGVMTNPECVEAAVVAVKDYTDRVTVVESDSGGYNPFSIDEVFEKTGIKALEGKYGVRVVNLASLPRRTETIRYKGQELSVPLSTLQLDESDLLVTIPVPKIHMNAGVSVSVKNQWGCIVEPTARLKLHPYFEKVIYEVNRAVKASVSIVDGRYGLNRSGPMRGDVVPLDWLMVADNIFAADVAACHLMQVDPLGIYYLRYLRDKEGVLPELDAIQFSQDYRTFLREAFYLKRAWTDQPGFLAFRSRSISYLAYFSPLADILHKILYLFREPFYDYDISTKNRKK